MTAPCAVCQVADGCHCLPLFPVTETCGCSVGDGHRCPPPWVDEWPESVAALGENAADQVESDRNGSAPGPGVDAPGITGGLTPRHLSEPGKER